MKMLIDEMKERGIHDEQILHYSFDSLEYEDIKTAKALFAHLKQHLFLKGRTYLFLDEIQEVRSWEKVVNSLMTDYDVDIYVTGSNSRMMSSELSTYLTGRYIAFCIYPLSFSEYMTFRKEYTEVLDSNTELANYLRIGCFPAKKAKNGWYKYDIRFALPVSENEILVRCVKLYPNGKREFPIVKEMKPQLTLILPVLSRLALYLYILRKEVY